MTHLAQNERVEETTHVNGTGLGVLGKTVENIEDVVANKVATVDGYRVADDGALVLGQGRMGQRANQDPGEEADVVDAVDELFGALLVVRGQVGQPRQVLRI